jgi:glycosyltransferase involved in cell wall biosynthesis
MRVIALIAVHNERRTIGACLDHLHRQGVETYVLDNMSTDDTASIVKVHPGVVAIESVPRSNDTFSLVPLLQRKEELAAELDADWFIHMDADEIRLPPQRSQTLVEGLADAGRAGFNTVNFFEFTFIPTREVPDHDHPRFQETMRSYYPFQPWFPHRVQAWRRPVAQVDLASSAGHEVRFPGVKLAPWNFPMRHYLFLSQKHAIDKYVRRTYAPESVARGWSGWRVGLQREMVSLPPSSELRVYDGDETLDPANPWTEHYISQVRRRVEAGSQG